MSSSEATSEIGGFSKYSSRFSNSQTFHVQIVWRRVCGFIFLLLQLRAPVSPTMTPLCPRSPRMLPSLSIDSPGKSQLRLNSAHHPFLTCAQQWKGSEGNTEPFAAQVHPPHCVATVRRCISLVSLVPLPLRPSCVFSLLPSAPHSSLMTFLSL